MKCGPNSKYKLFAMFIQASLHGTRGIYNLATTWQALARVLACLYLSAKLSTPLGSGSLFRQVVIPTGRYSDRSLFRQVDIPTYRSLFRQVVIPTGRYSDRSLFRQVDIPTNRSLFRQVDSPTNRSIFREFYIPTKRSIF